ncbi:Release factor glutamine methyltransferase [Saezia sanguinis]|uniref:Release factor glutamine methyltransferase n=2 Tax=Saezia sanguinis TaxID=1965230 RepID=A0A433SB88_9BURK|nr:Release factor glutamine methyltransferase [Saezia sanguinis]
MDKQKDRLMPTIDDIDFASLYRAHAEQSSRKSKPPSAWDERSQKLSLTEDDSANPYVQAFIAHMDLQGAHSLLDIGCGGGAIGLALARQLKAVYALDYSPGMLHVVKCRAQALGLSNVHVLQHSWHEYGPQAWCDVPVCDVVVASRSTMVDDMADALHKINSKARLRAYMTLMVEPRAIPAKAKETAVAFPDYIYAVNLLAQMGYLPRVDYLDQKGNRCTTYPAQDGGGSDANLQQTCSHWVWALVSWDCQ